MSDIVLQDFAREGIGLAERHQLTQALYDELMTAILRVIAKLDLTAISKGGEVFFCVLASLSFCLLCGFLFVHVFP